MFSCNEQSGLKKSYTSVNLKYVIPQFTSIYIITWRIVMLLEGPTSKHACFMCT